MKKFLLAVTALAFGTTIANAADMAVKTRPAPAYAAMAYNWSGVYIGAQGGYGFGRSHQDQAGASTGDYNINGWFAGGTLGFNWQMSSIVFGLETDISWANISGTTAPGVVGTYGCVNGCRTSVDWFGTARGRVGFAANNFLFYGTGGLAYGRVNAKILGAEAAGFDGSSTQLGWTGGGGIEYGFTPNLSAKVEYLYVDLGSFNFGQTGTVAAGARTDARFHTVKGGLNFRFGG